MRWTRTAAAVIALALCSAATALAQGQTKTPARMPHRTLNKTDCLSCHGAGANAHVVSVPASQHSYPNTMCARCHRPAAEMPSRSQHPFDAAHARCAVCHVTGNTVNAQPVPADHANRHATTCVMCHEPQSAT